MTADGKLFNKFNVTRTDGTDAPGQKHDGCRYFVLDVTHDPHAIPALAAYADAAEAAHPELAADMREQYGLRQQPMQAAPIRNMSDGASLQDYLDQLCVGNLTPVDQMALDQKLHDVQAAPVCPDCKFAAVFYECPACSASNYPPDVQAAPGAVVDLARQLVKKYIANSGTDSQFISCITPNTHGDDKELRKNPTAALWIDLRDALYAAPHATPVVDDAAIDRAVQAFVADKTGTYGERMRAALEAAGRKP